MQASFNYLCVLFFHSIIYGYFNFSMTSLTTYPEGLVLSCSVATCAKLTYLIIRLNEINIIVKINVEKQLYSGLLVPCYFSAPSAWSIFPLTLQQVQKTLLILQNSHQAWLPWKQFSCFHPTLLLPRKRHQASLLWPSIESSVHSHDSNFSCIFPILPLSLSFRKHESSYLLQGIVTII